MRKMPVDQILIPLERDDVAESAAHDEVVHASKEWRIAEYVADLKDSAESCRGLHHLHTFASGCGHRLLQQHVVASLEQGQRAGMMRAVHGGVDSCSSELRSLG